MNEEEKKAIEELKQIINYCNTMNLDFVDYGYEINGSQFNAIKIILNLIEKQQEEIEELKDIKDMVQILFKNNLPKEDLILITGDHLKNTGYKHLLDNYISKDKIKDEIKRLEFFKKTVFAPNEISAQVYKEQIDLFNMQINVLKELLEEE